MGLSSEVNAYIKEVLKNAPPGTRSNSMTYPEADAKRQHVIITDMMASPNGVFSWFKPNTNPKDDVPMTGLDYWEKFKNFILTRMGMKPRYFVITVDDRKLVPKEKEPTQLNRLKYSKVKEPIRLDEEAESKGLLFYDDGLVYPGGRITAEPIPPSLCRGSSHLRKPLARYLLHKLETWLRENLSTCTSFWGTSLIFDYDGFRFLVLEFDAVLGLKVTWCDYVKAFPVYGEADGKVVAWANFFMDQYNTQIETVDTDILGWATKLVRVHEEKRYNTYLHWITKDKSTGHLVVTELRMAIKYLCASLQFTTYRQLLLWMILPGTDYWTKSELTNGFGHKDIAKAIRRLDCACLVDLIFYDSINNPTLFSDRHEEEIRQTKSCLITLLKGFDYKLGSVKHKNKPDDTKLQELACKLWWHIGYWEMNCGISLDIIKKCQQQKQKGITTTTLKSRNLISPLIPVPLEPL